MQREGRRVSGNKATIGQAMIFHFVCPGVTYARLIGYQKTVIGQSSRKVVTGQRSS
jgi:hypothetical protein